MSVPKCRAYVFTWNNYPEDSDECLTSLNYEYMVYGREVAPSTGTPHIQGYVYLRNANTMKAIEKRCRGIHLAKALGSADSNFNYCSKEGNYIELGKKPIGQGKRSDIASTIEMVKEGARMKDIVLQASNLQCITVAEKSFKYLEQERKWKPYVEWYYGETGTGKTKTAYEELDEPYTAMSTGRWFEGYDAHENVVIDDMRKDFMKFHELLRLLDRYPMRVETKGGSRQFLAKRIIITSAYHPKELFDTREDIDQLIRRIDKIKQFGNLGKNKIYCNIIKDNGCLPETNNSSNDQSDSESSYCGSN